MKICNVNVQFRNIFWDSTNTVEDAPFISLFTRKINRVDLSASETGWYCVCLRNGFVWNRQVQKETVLYYIRQNNRSRSAPDSPFSRIEARNSFEA